MELITVNVLAFLALMNMVYIDNLSRKINVTTEESSKYTTDIEEVKINMDTSIKKLTKEMHTSMKELTKEMHRSKMQVSKYKTIDQMSEFGVPVKDYFETTPEGSTQPSGLFSDPML